MTTALYSGSFDPVTFGHIDVMRRASRLFPRLVVAIGAHHSKKALFSAEERVEMLQVIAGRSRPRQAMPSSSTLSRAWSSMPHGRPERA